MNDQTIAAVALVVAAVIAGLFAVGGAKYSRRKEKVDAASIVTATALSLLAPLNLDIAKLTTRLDAVETDNQRLAIKVASLEADNRNLRSENTGLRARVTTLETQLVDLGHVPANGSAIVTTSTTETVKTTTQGDAA